MRKKLFTSIFFSFILIASLGTAYAYTKSPWEEKSDKNLFKLINDGFEIVNGVLFTPPNTGGFMEFLYLKKGKQLYRCITVRRGEAQHQCESLVNPER